MALDPVAAIIRAVDLAVVDNIIAGTAACSGIPTAPARMALDALARITFAPATMVVRVNSVAQTTIAPPIHRTVTTIAVK